MASGYSLFIAGCERDTEPCLSTFHCPRAGRDTFPEMVGHLVQRLRATFPTLGKVKVAQMLARAGLHLSVSTVKRLSEQVATKPPAAPTPALAERDVASKPRAERVVKARHPHHVWNIDLTRVPILGEFWVPWLPRALVPVWPLCWHVLIVMDHYSRKVLGCDRNDVTPRFGAVGQHGSIAVLERFIRTLKGEGMMALPLPLSLEAREELRVYVRWYHQWRPHQGLEGRTPNEVYQALPPARAAPRHEPRQRYPRGRRPAKSPPSSCRGRRGEKLRLVVSDFAGRRHLPVVELRRAA